jgi:hypothetical protein
MRLDLCTRIWPDTGTEVPVTPFELAPPAGAVVDLKKDHDARLRRGCPARPCAQRRQSRAQPGIHIFDLKVRTDTKALVSRRHLYGWCASCGHRVGGHTRRQTGRQTGGSGWDQKPVVDRGNGQMVNKFEQPMHI